MPPVDWIGSAPSDRVKAGLRERGVDILVRRQVPDGAGPMVLCSRDARRAPRGAAGRPWIWVSKAPIPDRLATDAVLRGAYDVISVTRADAVATLARRISELLTPEAVAPRADTIVTISARARRIIDQVARVAATSMPVLLTGETGTGKEVMARLIHAWSSRRDKRFVPINCAAIPNELMEAELFGYARGAFSGAVQRYDGQLMAAEGGTVFLDEIDDTPLETQIKLLRVLEDRVVSRLGENVWHEVDFRILAATNRDLRPLVDAGAFGDGSLRAARDRHDQPAAAPRAGRRPRAARPVTSWRDSRASRDARRSTASGRTRCGCSRRTRGRQHPRASERDLRDAGLQARRERDPPLRLAAPCAARGGERPVTRRRGSAPRGATGSARGAMNLRDEVAALERVALDEALKRTGGNAAQAARLLGAVGRGRSRDPGGTVRAMMRRLRTR